MRLKTGSRLRGRFRMPGDKSICHRLALFAALAEGPSRLGNFSTGADCQSTLNCLQALGVSLHRQGADVFVDGKGAGALRWAGEPLDAGNSGSTLRMLAGLLAGRPFASTLTGDESLRRRPVERVAAPLRAMGAQVETADGKPPVKIQGGGLKAVSWDLPVASAQVKTAILLAGLQADGVTTVREPAQSRDHTERLLPAFGAKIETGNGGVSVTPQAALTPVDLDAPGDVSSAAFLVVAALVLPDSCLRIDGVCLNPQRTAFLDVLLAMGADLETCVVIPAPEPVGWIEARSSRLTGTEIAASAIPALIDEIPALAVAGALADGELVVRGAEELRVKESDRIRAMVQGLGALGAVIEERPDGFVVRGGRPLRGAAVRSYGDHRIAMALSIAALAAGGETEIDDAQCASISFPEFYAFLDQGLAG